jgi:hypothetical protein
LSIATIVTRQSKTRAVALGLLNVKSGIPICETASSTPPGQFSWQDLIMLKYEIPMQWQNGASFLMNQRTFALLLTMSDAGGRPMWSSLPGRGAGLQAGREPDHDRLADARRPARLDAGSLGNWKQAYMIVRSSTWRPTTAASARSIATPSRSSGSTPSTAKSSSSTRRS